VRRFRRCGEAPSSAARSSATCSSARDVTRIRSHEIRGQRVDSVVRIVDKPAEDATVRSFLVERGLTSQAELNAVVADYVAQSKRRDEPAALRSQRDPAPTTVFKTPQR
jgi:hypothetical protein